MVERGERQEALQQARTALERGRFGQSVRHAWTAALAAIHDRDTDQLGAVLALARRLEEQASGRWKSRAAVLANYCSAALEEGLQTVERRVPWLGRLFGGAERAETKQCPDCAETVKAAARVCRFCGYRFES